MKCLTLVFDITWFGPFILAKISLRSIKNERKTNRIKKKTLRPVAAVKKLVSVKLLKRFSRNPVFTLYWFIGNNECLSSMYIVYGKVEQSK